MHFIHFHFLPKFDFKSKSREALHGIGQMCFKTRFGYGLNQTVVEINKRSKCNFKIPIYTKTCKQRCHGIKFK